MGSTAVINAVINLTDNLTPRLRTVVSTSNAAIKSMISQQNALNNVLNNSTAAYKTNLTAQAKFEQNQTRQGMSTTRLIAMMVKFGIILKALQIATTPLKLISEGARDLIETDRGVREITAMLAESTDTASEKLIRYNFLVGQSQLLQRQFGFTAKDSAEGLYQIASVVQTLNFEGYASTLEEGITKLTSASGRLAIGGFMPLAEATSGMATVFNALDMPVRNVDEVMDIMFNAVKIGKGHMSDLTNNMGAFLEVLGDLSNEGTRMKAFQETMGIFGYLTTVISPGRAGTATRRLLEGVAARSPQQQQLIRSIQSAFGIDLTATRFAEVGPADYFKTLLGAVGPESPQLAALIAGRTGVPATEAQMRAVSTGIIEQFTGDKRAAQALLALSKQGQFEKVFGVMAQRGSAAAAEQEGMEAYTTQWNIFTQRLDVIGQTLQMTVMPKIFGFFSGVSDVLEKVMSNQEYTNAGSTDKIKMLLGGISGAFEAWYKGGPREMREGTTGRDEIYRTFRDLGGNAASAFVGALGIALPGEINKDHNLWFEAGHDMASALVGGFFSNLGSIVSTKGLGAVGDMAANPLVRAALTFFGLKRVGVPGLAALGLGGLAGAGAMSDFGMGGNAIAALLPILGTLSLGGGAFSRGKAIKDKMLQDFSAVPGLYPGIKFAAGATTSLFTGAKYPAYSTYSAPANSLYPGVVPGQWIPGVGYMAPPMTPAGKQLRNFGYSAQQMNAQTMVRTPGGLFVPATAPAAPGRMSRIGGRIGRSMNFIRGSGGAMQVGAMGNMAMGMAGAYAGSEIADRFFPDNQMAQVGLPIGMMAVGGALGITGGLVLLAGGLVVKALWETALTIGTITDNMNKVPIALNNWMVENKVLGAQMREPGALNRAINAEYGNRPTSFDRSQFFPEEPSTRPVIHINFDIDHMNMDKGQLREFAVAAYDAFAEQFGSELSNTGGAVVYPVVAPGRLQ